MDQVGPATAQGGFACRARVAQPTLAEVRDIALRVRRPWYLRRQFSRGAEVVLALAQRNLDLPRLRSEAEALHRRRE